MAHNFRGKCRINGIHPTVPGDSSNNLTCQAACIHHALQNLTGMLCL